MGLVGNGFTTSDARTGQRISANVQMFQPWPQPDGVGLNCRFATEVPGPNVGSSTNDPGFAFANCGEGPGHIIISKTGYKTLEMDVVFPIPTNVAYVLEPDVVPLSRWRRDGVNVLNESGAIERLRGLTAFSAIMHHANGDLDRLLRFADKTHELGGNTWRVFSCFDAVPSVSRPSFRASRDQIAAAVDFMRVRCGIHPWLVGFCDQFTGSAVLMNQGDQDRHWENCQALGVDVLEGENEPFKASNGGYELSSRLPRPRAGILATRGAVGDEADSTPSSAGALLDACTAHTRRVPGDQARRAKDALEYEVLGGGALWSATGLPCWLGEPFRLSESTARECADYYALGELMASGAVVHDEWATLQSCLWPTDGRVEHLNAIRAVWAADIRRDLVTRFYDRDSILTGDGVRHYVLHDGAKGIGVGVGANTVQANNGWRIVDRRGYNGNVIFVER